MEASATRRALSDRAVLGTVQLGPAYGPRTGESPLGDHESHTILETAWEAGFRIFDTAEAYGDAPLRLQRWLKKRRCLAESHIVTKVSPADAADARRIAATCRRFEGAASVALFTHGAVDAPRFATMRDLARDLADEVGQSVYSATDVRAAAEAGSARVQAPGNLLDQRQITAAREAHVAIDVRSVFLQGILLESTERARARVPDAAPLVSAIRSAARQLDLPPAAVLIAAVLARLDSKDRVLIGIDAPQQIHDVTAAFEIPVSHVREFIHLVRSTGCLSLDPSILDPRCWPQPS
jgi:aryl-alcohol dehydrogenase-like predicted oxidoreductase